MKKALAVVLVVSFMLLTGTAFAADIPNPLDLKFDGSLTLQYRNDSVKFPTSSYNGLKTLGVMNVTKSIGDQFGIYARATYENLGGSLNPKSNSSISGAAYGSPADYANAKYNSRYNGTIDAFGLTFNDGGWNWKLGSQALTIGQGMIYDNGFIGSHALPYAISGTGKVGVVDTTVIIAKTNYQGAGMNGGTLLNDKFDVLQFGYDVSPKANIGAFYTHWAAGDTNGARAAMGSGSESFYGINTVYKFDGKLSFNGEATKSSANTNNKAYIGGLTYAFDNVDKVSASYYRSEDLSNINDQNFGGMTTAPNANTKGYIFSWGHKFSSDLNLRLGYDSYTHINAAAVTGATNDRNRTTLGVTYVF